MANCTKTPLERDADQWFYHIHRDRRNIYHARDLAPPWLHQKTMWEGVLAVGTWKYTTVVLSGSLIAERTEIFQYSTPGNKGN